MNTASGQGGGGRAGTIRPVGQRAYTLIELMVVIAIIAIVAGLVIALANYAFEARDRSLISTKLGYLVKAIEEFKAARGYYPPDNTNDFSKPPLYYELLGSRVVTLGGVRKYQTLTTQSEIAETDLPAAFGVSGFSNVEAGSDADKTKDFLRNVDPAEVKESGPPGAKYLGVPVKSSQGKFCRVWYNSSNPTNNPNGYDLWIEVIEKNGRVRTIYGNWKN